MSESTTAAGAAATLPEYDYPIHSYAALNPPMPEDQRSSLELDIRKNGIREQIVLYKTPKGIFLIDGRHRLNIYNKLAREGVTVTETGEALDLPVWYLPDDTSPMEALRFIISKSQRRIAAHFLGHRIAQGFAHRGGVSLALVFGLVERRRGARGRAGIARDGST